MPLPKGFEYIDSPVSEKRTLPEGFEYIDEPPAKENYSWADVPEAAFRNLGKSGAEFYSGLANAAIHPIQTAKNIGKLGVGALLSATLDEKGRELVKGLSTYPEQVQGAIDLAQNVGQMYKDRYYGENALKSTIAEDPVGFAADLSTLLSGGAGVAGKLGKAGAMRNLNIASKVTNPLAPVSLAVSLAKKPASAIKGVGTAVFNPKNALYLRATEGKGEEIMNALRNAEELVPGSLPTAAQAAADTGVVGFQKLGKSAAGVLESEYKGRQMQQEGAQLAAIRSVGKDQAALEKAKNVREMETRDLYQKSDNKLSEIDTQFIDLARNRPSMTTVLARARSLMKEKGLSYMEDGHLTGTAIHAIKQSFDDLIKNPERFGIGAEEARAITGTKRDFLEWADQVDKNPSYRLARERFAELSEPINVMNVGQYLENKLLPTLGEESANLRVQSYGNALADAPSTIKRSTGESRFKDLEGIFKNDPEALSILYSVRDDMSRQARSARLAKGDVSDKYNVEKAAEAISGNTVLPNMINRVTTLANDIWRKMRGRIDKTVAIEVAQEMLFPETALNAIGNALKQQQKFKTAGRMVTQPTNALYRTPATLNMLSPTQNQNDLSQ